MAKKNLTKASEAAVNKFFSNPENDGDINNNDKISNVTNKSKHYDERGKRDLRHVLLLDKQLKEDLTRLCHATENRSVNDYIISLLIEHTEQPENKKLLENYQKLRDGVTV
jgi:hypothetical protein